jgi:hypothetical protein
MSAVPATICGMTSPRCTTSPTNDVNSGSRVRGCVHAHAEHRVGGATAVQIVHSSRRGSRDIEHLGPVKGLGRCSTVRTRPPVGCSLRSSYLRLWLAASCPCNRCNADTGYTP